MINSLTRINELARKEREEGLTKSEWVEQIALREDYLREIRGQVRNSLSGVTIVDPEEMMLRLKKFVYRVKKL